jgi:hypothetical protein
MASTDKRLISPPAMLLIFAAGSLACSVSLPAGARDGGNDASLGTGGATVGPNGSGGHGAGGFAAGGGAGGATTGVGGHGDAAAASGGGAGEHGETGSAGQTGGAGRTGVAGTPATGGVTGAGGGGGAGDRGVGGSPTNGSGGTTNMGSGGSGAGGRSLSGSGGAGLMGSGGANGSGGAAAGGMTGARRLALIPVNGWVDKATNDVGIQGAWYTYADAGATIAPADFRSAGPSICVTGTAVNNSAVGYEPLYATVAVGLSNGSTPAYYPTTPDGVVGLSFTMSGTVMPNLLVRILTAKVGYECIVFHATSGAKITALFADATAKCQLNGQPGDFASAPALTDLMGVEWRVTSSSGTGNFDFCMTNVSAVLKGN